MAAVYHHARRSANGLGLSLAAALTLVAGCGEPPPGRGRLERIKAEGELLVLTRNAPTVYYRDRQGLAGPEYDMAEAFADSLDVEARFEVVGSVREILDRLADGEGDLAAAGITRTPAREDEVLFGPAYQEISQQVVCRRGGASPDEVSDLVGLEIVVEAGTSYDERLGRLATEHPGLEWDAVKGVGTETLLQRVWRREIDCTVADSNIVAVNRRYHPELEVAFDLGRPQELAWAMPPGARRLRGAVLEWLKAYRREGLLERLREHYYGFIRIFDYVELAVYRRRIAQRLPAYRDVFERAGRRYGIPWTLLAAQGYQESHWNPRARSPTGVRGIMMLTRVTAREVGVEDRLDPTQSIMGGARYLSRMIGRLDDAVEGPDRMRLALAAYNVGVGHLRDAQELARRMGRDPHRWSEVREVLPLLAQPRYYKTLQYGYARGMEPVRYVQRIRNYRDILERRLGFRGGGG